MKHMLWLCLLVACGGKPAPTAVPTKMALKSVWVLGDSISIGYTPFVESSLKGTATVEHSYGNSRNTKHTLLVLDKWLYNKSFDLITWNNGIWDCYYGDDGSWFTDPEVYEDNLRLIAAKLRKHAKQVVFIATTKIPLAVPTGLDPGCEVERNEIAKAVTAELKIPFYDLHEISAGLDDDRVNPDLQNDVHYSEVGYEKLSVSVRDWVKRELRKLSP